MPRTVVASYSKALVAGSSSEDNIVLPEDMNVERIGITWTGSKNALVNFKPFNNWLFVDPIPAVMITGSENSNMLPSPEFMQKNGTNKIKYTIDPADTGGVLYIAFFGKSVK